MSNSELALLARDYLTTERVAGSEIQPSDRAIGKKAISELRSRWDQIVDEAFSEVDAKTMKRLYYQDWRNTFGELSNISVQFSKQVEKSSETPPWQKLLFRGSRGISRLAFAGSCMALKLSNAVTTDQRLRRDFKHPHMRELRSDDFLVSLVEETVKARKNA